MPWFGWVFLAPFFFAALIVLVVGARPSAADSIEKVLRVLPAVVREMVGKPPIGRAGHKRGVI